MKKHSSFTLIEVLLAIFILEIGLLGIAGFYVSSFKTVKVARNETAAANLASGILDEESAVSYDNLIVQTGTKTNYTTDTTNPFYNWQKKVDVAYIDDNLNVQTINTHMKKITVTVYWQENSSEKSFETATVKAEH